VYDRPLDLVEEGDVKRVLRVFAGLFLGLGLLAVGSGLSGCTKDNLTTGSQGSLCAQACTNFVAKCGVSGSSSFSSSSSSGTTPECIQMCDKGLGSKSGSSSVEYKDLLTCVASAKSCVEIKNSCSP
jgi:hypothetical protein